MIFGWTSNPAVPCWTQKMNEVATFCEANIADGLDKVFENRYHDRFVRLSRGHVVLMICVYKHMDSCCVNLVTGGVYSAPSPYWICRGRKDTTTASVIGFKNEGFVRQLLWMWLSLSPVSCVLSPVSCVLPWCERTTTSVYLPGVFSFIAPEALLSLG